MPSRPTAFSSVLLNGYALTATSGQLAFNGAIIDPVGLSGVLSGDIAATAAATLASANAYTDTKVNIVSGLITGLQATGNLLNNKINTLSGNLSGLSGIVLVNSGDIATLQGDVTTLNTNYGTLQTNTLKVSQLGVASMDLAGDDNGIARLDSNAYVANRVPWTGLVNLPNSISVLANATPVGSLIYDISPYGLTMSGIRATNMSGNHISGTVNWNIITGKPTTLTGYGIIDGLSLSSGNALYQPLDSDLTAISAIATTSFGRNLLSGANASAIQNYLGLGTMATQASSSYLAVSNSLSELSATTETAKTNLRLAIHGRDWNSTQTYDSGTFANLSGNTYRAKTAVSANVSPGNDTGSFWELSHIYNPVTLNIPSKFLSLNDAWSFIRNAQILSSGSATIQFADGVYNMGSSRYLLNHPNGNRIKILGNITGNVTGGANSVTLSWTGSTYSSPSTYANDSWGYIVVSSGNSSPYINGFKFAGPGVSNITYGALAWNGATLNFGSKMYISGFYAGLAAFWNSSIYADGVRVSHGGDGNLFAYGNCSISFQSGWSHDASTYYAQAGACIEFSSTLFAPNAIFSGNGSAGIAADWNSSLMVDNASFFGSSSTYPAIKCIGGQIGVQANGVTYTNCASSNHSIYEGTVNNSETSPIFRAGLETPYESFFGAFAFVSDWTKSSISLTQNNVATAFFGLQNSPNVSIGVDNAGGRIDMKVGLSRSLTDGTTVGSFSAVGLDMKGLPIYNNNVERLLTGVSNVLTSGDNGKILRYTNNATGTLFLPNANMPAQFSCTVVQDGTGTLTMSGVSGAISNYRFGPRTAGQYAMANLYIPSITGSVRYIIAGDTTA